MSNGVYSGPLEGFFSPGVLRYIYVYIYIYIYIHMQARIQDFLTGGGGGPETRKLRRPFFSTQRINTDQVILEAPYRYLQADTILERGQSHVTSLVRYLNTQNFARLKILTRRNFTVN